MKEISLFLFTANAYYDNLFLGKGREGDINNMPNKKKIRILLAILLIIILLLLLVKCGVNKSPEAGIEEEVVIRNEEQTILREMKQDEEALIALYNRSDICSEEWIKEFIVLAQKMQKYHYTGTIEEIKELVFEYQGYGVSLEEIGLTLQEGNYEEGIELLTNLEETAERLEGELGKLYETYH